MFKNRKSLFIIAFALLALLGMQGMWLYYAIEQEKKFLSAGTRQAALECVNNIEQKEDSKILITSMDTLLDLAKDEAYRGNSQRSEVKVHILNGKREVRVKNNESETITTSYSYSGDGKNTAQVKIISEKKETRPDIKIERKAKGKIKNYEQLLKKIVYQSQPKNLNISERINFTELTKSLNENLLARGVDIKPEMAIKNKNGKVIFKTANYRSGAGITVPVFSKDIVSQGYTLNLFYPSSLNYIFKRAIGVIVLSALATILLIAVILLLYKKMLTEQKLNRYKNDFINNLTHELKTPLATIALASTNIAGAANFSRQDNILQYTKIIDEENKKLNDHIEKVFELSLLEKEKQIFDLRNSNIHELITESLEQYKPVIDKMNAAVDLSLQAGEHMVKVDKFHFKNVISNLVDNAIKYNSGKIEINIATKNAGDKFIVSVKDNGIGISKEHQEFIFDKFFRVTNNDLHTVKGFGIGLSYVKQTIGLFNGTVEVKSEENNGAEFIITIPYVKG